MVSYVTSLQPPGLPHDQLRRHQPEPRAPKRQGPLSLKQRQAEHTGGLRKVEPWVYLVAFVPTPPPQPPYSFRLSPPKIIFSLPPSSHFRHHHTMSPSDSKAEQATVQVNVDELRASKDAVCFPSHSVILVPIFHFSLFLDFFFFCYVPAHPLRASLDASHINKSF